MRSASRSSSCRRNRSWFDPGRGLSKIERMPVGMSKLESGFDRATSSQAFANSGVAKASSRSEEHTSELQSLMRISYAVFCLKQKHTKTSEETIRNTRYM